MEGGKARYRGGSLKDHMLVCLSAKAVSKKPKNC